MRACNARQGEARSALPNEGDREGYPVNDPAVAKARLLLINGHPHTAAELLQRALKAHPDDTHLAAYLDQAKGKLGNAELDFVGSGTVTIDGKTLPRPSKLKLAAGPHTIDGQEFVLARGEKRTVGSR